MGSAEADNLEGTSSTSAGGWLARAGLVALLLVFAAGAYVWVSRERIATDLIDGYLTDAGLEASYDIVSIGAQRQVIANLVVGDPAAPDLTVDRVSVDVRYGFFSAGLGAVTLVRPRLYGAYRDGALSFGALDPLVLGEDDTASAGLPAIDVTIREGGARLVTDFGEIGAFVQGTGPLNDGFAGKLALVAPNIGVTGCRAQRATAYGDLSITDGAPAFEGPVRLRGAACEGATIASADITAQLSTNADFAKLDGAFDLSTGALAYGENAAEGLTGRVTLSLSDEALVLDHDARLTSLQTPYVALSTVRADGAVRSARGFSESSWNAQIEGDEVALANGLSDALTDARQASEGTLSASLLAKLQSGLQSASRGASLRGDVTARMAGEALSLVVPEARLRSASGETLVAVSRLSWSQADANSDARLAGNILTGGADLPRITARIDQSDGAPLIARLSVAPYAAGEDRIAVPSLTVRGTGRGGYAFSGKVIANGALPGGAVERLEAPLNGRYDPRSGLRLASGCETVRFDALSVYSLALEAQSVRLCPGEGRALVSYSDALAIDAVSDAVALRGELGGAALDLSAARVAVRYPGGFEVDDVSATLGSPDNAVRLTSARVTGDLDGELQGAFAGGTAALDVVPLDLSDLAGRWAYTDSGLSVSDTRFTLTERTPAGEIARFNPLSSEGATLRLDGSDITALARLDHKRTRTPITRVAVAHNLSDAQGSALIAVEGVRFGETLAVDDLTDLARGVVAYTEGTITGEGRIDWTSEDVTSQGAFRTDGLDLAAAFGPVTGLKGEVRFSDLLNLTTEPGQVIEIGSINPGIEALGGVVRFSLKDGTNITVEDGRWPFMGGRLIMRPTTLRYGTDAEQRYVFEIIALDAATFVAQMELSNIGATGTFDGTIGVTFDSVGFGRIEQGLLISRAPGGNISYIGELTYEDMGAISNYAFQSLRSLDYRQMSVGLEGALAGEIITRFRIDGVRQGEDASQNFVTRRLAKLPIRFNVNVRSENFYELATMVRTFWDPDALPDAIDQGLISADGLRSRISDTEPDLEPSVQTPPSPPSEAPDPDTTGASDIEAIRPDEPRVQPPESENLP